MLVTAATDLQKDIVEGGRVSYTLSTYELQLRLNLGVKKGDKISLTDSI